MGMYAETRYTCDAHDCERGITIPAGSVVAPGWHTINIGRKDWTLCLPHQKAVVDLLTGTPQEQLEKAK